MNHAANAIDFVVLSSFSVLGGMASYYRGMKAAELYKASLEKPDVEVGYDPNVLHPGGPETKISTRARTQAHLESLGAFAAGVISAGCGAEALSIAAEYF